MNAVAEGAERRVEGRFGRAWLVWAMGLVVAGYAAGLALQGDASEPVVDIWLSLLTSWLPAVVCWLAVARVGFHRWDVVLAALAMTWLAGGDTYYTPWSSSWSPPFPSPGDLGYLLFYLMMLAALVVVVRDDVGAGGSSVWLDCVIGSLGAASVLAVLLSPVLDSALTGSLSLATGVSIAYPLFDLLLVAAVTGIVALGGVGGGSRLVSLVAGLMVFAAADVVYALQVTAETYVVGTPLDAGWAVGLVLIAVWVNGAERPDTARTPRPRPATGAAALAVSSVATAAGLGVLVVGTSQDLSTLAVTLAAVTLVAAAA